jgi:hypothetical protein
LEQYSVPGGLVVLQTGHTMGEAEVAVVLVLPVVGCAAAWFMGEPQLGQYPLSGTTDLPHVGHT